MFAGVPGYPRICLNAALARAAMWGRPQGCESAKVRTLTTIPAGTDSPGYPNTFEVPNIDLGATSGFGSGVMLPIHPAGELGSFHPIDSHLPRPDALHHGGRENQQPGHDIGRQSRS